MINCFYYKNEWLIATRSNIGANCKFQLQNEPTFREMFYDAMNQCKLDFSDLKTEYIHLYYNIQVTE